MIVRSSGSPCAMTCLLSLGESQDRQDRLVRRGRHLAVQLVGSRDEASEHGDEPGPTFRPERQVGLRAERSEEHTSELQSRQYLVCRLLLEKKKKKKKIFIVMRNEFTKSQTLCL